VDSWIGKKVIKTNLHNFFPPPAPGASLVEKYIMQITKSTLVKFPSRECRASEREKLNYTAMYRFHIRPEKNSLQVLFGLFSCNFPPPHRPPRLPPRIRGDREKETNNERNSEKREKEARAMARKCVLCLGVRIPHCIQIVSLPPSSF
jgi:hypothetical protein